MQDTKDKAGTATMTTATIWRVGLWQVWDDLPNADAPWERPPEALIERLAGTFDHYPSKEEADRAMTAAGVAIRHAFEEREILGHVVVTDDCWKTLRTSGGWIPDGSRRHPPGGRYAGRLSFEYDLAGDTGPSRPDTLWAPAKERVGPRLEDVADRLRSIGDAMGLPPAGLDSGLPVFAGREARAPNRRRQAIRDRDGSAL